MKRLGAAATLVLTLKEKTEKKGQVEQAWCHVSRVTIVTGSAHVDFFYLFAPSPQLAASLSFPGVWITNSFILTC
jgi:hypothetical protein